MLLFQQLAAIQKGFAYFNPDISPAAMYGILLGQWTNQGFFGPLFWCSDAGTHCLVLLYFCLCHLRSSSVISLHLWRPLPLAVDIVACAFTISADSFSRLCTWLGSVTKVTKFSCHSARTHVLMQALSESLSYCICLCKFTPFCKT